MSDLKATVLIDNIAKDDLLGEWGLSIHVQHAGKSVLLDTGATGDFVKNADALGIDLSQVDLGVLSHAHYDHSDGMEAFFACNDHAPFVLRRGAAENCYGKVLVFSRYIGIKKGMIEKYGDRISFADGDYQLYPGAWLIPHKTAGLQSIAKKSHMYRKEVNGWVLDDFSHEQSLVFDTSDGLVVFNSCSHGGADNIINEIARTFPEKNVLALIGGFHLFESPDHEVRALAKRIRETGIKHVVTGHCTGDKAFAILREELGDVVVQLHSGLVLEY